MSHRDVRDEAREFWGVLSPGDRWELGDQLVLGSLDWRDWLEKRPRPGFWSHVDYLRMLEEA